MEKDPLLLRDLHLHTTASWDAAAEMTPRAVAERARAMGLAVTGFADHLWLAPRGSSRPSAAYLLRCRDRLPACAGGPRLLLGVEADCAPGPGMAGGRDLASFDFVVGAYHFSDLRHGDVRPPSSPAGLSACLLAGFKGVLDAPRVDIVGHPFHLPWRAIERLPDGVRSRIPEAVGAAVAGAGPLLDIAAGRGIAVELNARALAPRARILLAGFFREARRRGVPFVISSDAHRLAEMDGMAGAADYAREIGIRPSDLWDPCAGA